MASLDMNSYRRAIYRSWSNPHSVGVMAGTMGETGGDGGGGVIIQVLHRDIGDTEPMQCLAVCSMYVCL